MWLIIKNTENLCKIKYIENYSALVIYDSYNQGINCHKYWDLDGINDVIGYITDEDKARKLYYLYTGSYVVSNKNWKLL